MDEEDAWRAISAAEEELRTQEALAAPYEPGDESIPELFDTRVMEREMLTREEAGKAAQRGPGRHRHSGHRVHAQRDRRIRP